VAATALAAAAALSAAPGAIADNTSDFNNAFTLGLQGYRYGEPLMNMQSVFKTETSVTVPDNQGDAPVNQWSHGTALVDAKEGIIAPNADTLYSIAWLDLKLQPIILHVPNTSGRFNVVPLLTPYEENIANIGNDFSGGLAPGNYMIAGPGFGATGRAAGRHSRHRGHPRRDQRTAVPTGMHVIHSPYDRVWLIARTEVQNQADTANAIAIQAQEKLVPLSKWRAQGLNYQPPAPKTVITTPTAATIPGTQPGEDPLDYWDALGNRLERFPPPAADQPLLKQLRTVGIGPGLHPSTNKHLSQGTLVGLRAAVPAGPGAVTQDALDVFEAGFTAHNGWAVHATGNYGTNYALRAIVDQIGLGALPPNVAIFPTTVTDRLESPLNGDTTRYVVHYPASDFPVPVQGFWSLTMYDSNGNFDSNPLNRHVLNDRSTLHHNTDGSLDLYVQNTEPTDPNQQDNWLPAPAATFQLNLRLYRTEQNDIARILNGGPSSPWQMPTILPCLPSGATPALPTAGILTPIACAN
jgi:hypothetical protein